MKTMTNILKSVIVMFVLILVVVLYISGLSLAEVSSKKQIEVDMLLARKEDLLLEQQRLEDLMNSLNKSIQLEIMKQNLLLEKLSSVESAQDVAQERALLAQKNKDIVLNTAIPKVTPVEVTTSNPVVVNTPTSRAS